MTQPDIKDTNAIGGAHPGTSTRQELANNISFKTRESDTLGEAATRVLSAAEYQFSSLSDTNASSNYATDPNVSYYGAGSLSLVPRLGSLVFGANTNEADRGAFRLDQSESSLYSNLSDTTLGSLNIDTVDGQLLNPVSTQRPSTNYSPTKPWIKKLFPSLSSKNVATIAILEIVQAMVLKLVDKDRSQLPSENIESKQDADIATIIVDNQEIENKLFSGN